MFSEKIQSTPKKKQNISILGNFAYIQPTEKKDMYITLHPPHTIPQTRI